MNIRFTRSLQVAYLRVHVGTVQVHLSAVLMDELTNFTDVLLKHSVCGGVRDHDGSQICLMFVHLLESIA